MNPPTDRQLLILCAVASFIQEHRHAPSHREICEAVGGISKQGVASHLDYLERKRLIGRAAGVSRGLWVTGAGLDAVRAAACA